MKHSKVYIYTLIATLIVGLCLFIWIKVNSHQEILRFSEEFIETIIKTKNEEKFLSYVPDTVLINKKLRNEFLQEYLKIHKRYKLPVNIKSQSYSRHVSHIIDELPRDAFQLFIVSDFNNAEDINLVFEFVLIDTSWYYVGYSVFEDNYH